jgi:hypothetical protein
VHLQTCRAQDAIPLYLQALKLNPAHWPSRAKLVEGLMATKQYLAARAHIVPGQSEPSSNLLG